LTRLWAAPTVLDAYSDLFERLPIEAFVAHLLQMVRTLLESMR